MFENMMKILVFTVFLFSVLSVVCAQDTNNQTVDNLMVSDDNNLHTVDFQSNHTTFNSDILKDLNDDEGFGNVTYKSLEKNNTFDKTRKENNSFEIKLGKNNPFVIKPVVNPLEPLSVNGSITQSNPNKLLFKTLQEAINCAHDGDTIIFAPGTYTGTGNVGLTINKNLNLVKFSDGDVIFDGQKTNQIFNVISSKGLNITGLTFINGKSEYGGAIRFNQLINSHINATFIFNNAQYGGALFVNNSVYNSTINAFYKGNLAKVSGHDGGGANYFKGDISNSTITGSYINNTAWSGGANFILGNIQNSYITGLYINNTAKNAGGANHFRGKIIKSDINGKYNNNRAHSMGGANYFDQIIDDSTIDGFYNANLAEVSGHRRA